MIYNLVWRSPLGKLDLSDCDLQSHYIKSESDRSPVAEALCSELKSIDSKARTEKIRCIVEQYRELLTEDIRHRGADWEQVRKGMPLMDTGAHTVHHHILSYLSPEDSQKEIVQSKRTIEGKIGAEVNSFAYPNGGRADFTDVTKETVKREGFHSAVTSLPGANYPGDDMWELKRIGIGRHQVLQISIYLVNAMPIATFA